MQSILVFLYSCFIDLTLCIKFCATYYMHPFQQILFYAFCSMHLDFCILSYVTCSFILFYVSCPMYMGLCTLFWASPSMHLDLYISFCSMYFILRIWFYASGLWLYPCISFFIFFTFHSMHLNVASHYMQSTDSSLSIHFILFSTFKLVLKLVGDRPTNRPTDRHCHV